MQQHNFFQFFLLFFWSIFHVIPFIVVDIYYSYLPYDYRCLDYPYIDYDINIRHWFKVNGYLSLASVLLIFLTSTMIYLNKCLLISNFLQTPYFIKSYVFLRISFSFIWNVIGIIIISNMYNNCSRGLASYVIIRICSIFIFIGMSIKTIKDYICGNTGRDNRDNEMINTIEG